MPSSISRQSLVSRLLKCALAHHLPALLNRHSCVAFIDALVQALVENELQPESIDAHADAVHVVEHALRVLKIAPTGRARKHTSSARITITATHPTTLPASSEPPSIHLELPTASAKTLAKHFSVLIPHVKLCDTELCWVVLRWSDAQQVLRIPTLRVLLPANMQLAMAMAVQPPLPRSLWDPRFEHLHGGGGPGDGGEEESKGTPPAPAVQSSWLWGGITNLVTRQTLINAATAGAVAVGTIAAATLANESIDHPSFRPAMATTTLLVAGVSVSAVLHQAWLRLTAPEPASPVVPAPARPAAEKGGKREEGESDDDSSDDDDGEILGMVQETFLQTNRFTSLLTQQRLCLTFALREEDFGPDPFDNFNAFLRTTHNASAQLVQEAHEEAVAGGEEPSAPPWAVNLQKLEALESMLEMQAHRAAAQVFQAALAHMEELKAGDDTMKAAAAAAAIKFVSSFVDPTVEVLEGKYRRSLAAAKAIHAEMEVSRAAHAEYERISRKAASASIRAQIQAEVEAEPREHQEAARQAEITKLRDAVKDDACMGIVEAVQWEALQRTPESATIVRLHRLLDHVRMVSTTVQDTILRERSLQVDAWALINNAERRTIERGEREVELALDAAHAEAEVITKTLEGAPPTSLLTVPMVAWALRTTPGKLFGEPLTAKDNAQVLRMMEASLRARRKALPATIVYELGSFDEDVIRSGVLDLPPFTTRTGVHVNPAKLFAAQRQLAIWSSPTAFLNVVFRLWRDLALASDSAQDADLCRKWRRAFLEMAGHRWIPFPQRRVDMLRAASPLVTLLSLSHVALVMDKAIPATQSIQPLQDLNAIFQTAHRRITSAVMLLTNGQMRAREVEELRAASECKRVDREMNTVERSTAALNAMKKQCAADAAHAATAESFMTACIFMWTWDRAMKGVEQPMRRLNVANVVRAAQITAEVAEE